MDLAITTMGYERQRNNVTQMSFCLYFVKGVGEGSAEC